MFYVIIKGGNQSALYSIIIILSNGKLMILHTLKIMYIVVRSILSSYKGHRT